MRLPVALGAGLFALSAATAALAAYPERAVTIVVPFGAGDSVDGTARVIAENLQEDLGVPFVVKNVPAGGGAAGTAEVARAPADGYTLLMASTGALTARPQVSDAGYETDDFAPIAQLVTVPIALAVAKDSPYKTLDELLAAAKDKPLKYATPAPASTQHLSMTAFAKENGLKLVHVGGQGGKGAVTKTLTGETDFTFTGAPNFTALQEAGEMRVLAVAAPKRVPYMPDTPTFAEAGHDLDASVWFGLVARKDVPDEALASLRKVVGEVAQSPATLELYEKFDFTPAYLDADAFGDKIQADVERSRGTLTDLGLLKK